MNKPLVSTTDLAIKSWPPCQWDFQAWLPLQPTTQLSHTASAPPTQIKPKQSDFPKTESGLREYRRLYARWRRAKHPTPKKPAKPKPPLIKPKRCDFSSDYNGKKQFQNAWQKWTRYIKSLPPSHPDHYISQHERRNRRDHDILSQPKPRRQNFATRSAYRTAYSSWANAMRRLGADHPLVLQQRADEAAYAAELKAARRPVPNPLKPNRSVPGKPCRSDFAKDKAGYNAYQRAYQKWRRYQATPSTTDLTRPSISDYQSKQVYHSAYKKWQKAVKKLPPSHPQSWQNQQLRSTAYYEKILAQPKPRPKQFNNKSEYTKHLLRWNTAIKVLPQDHKLVIKAKETPKPNYTLEFPEGGFVDDEPIERDFGRYFGRR